MKKTGPFRIIVYSKMTSILLFFFLSTFIVLSLWFDHKLNQSQKRRYLSYVAADELRQSSDDLTRMVRTYVVMKDPRYEKMYWDILAIRKGEKARPIRYENIYWDFIAFTNEKPRPDGQKISLLKIMEDLEFTREEFEKLAEAEKHSNDLVKTEMLAMHAMKGEFLDAEGEFTLRGEPDYDYAQSLLFGESYHSDKVDIMAPIDEFFVMVNARTEAQVSRDTIYTYICIFLVCATITLLLWLSRVELNERKLTEGNLRQSEKKFKDFMMSANEGFVLYNADLNLSEINDKALEIFPPESTKENLLGKNILDIALSLKETGRYDKYVAVKDTGEPLYFDDIIPDPIFGDRHLSIKAFKVGGGLGMIFSDITERKKNEKELKNYQMRLKALASQLTIAEEKARRAIAADLHDHVGHFLALARMQLNGILDSNSDLERKVIVKDISHIILQALQDTRSLIFELSSPSMDEIGLGAAISEWLEEHIEKRHGLKIEFNDTTADAYKKTLSENMRAILFRNVRELLTNVVKHAQANQVTVSMEHTDDVLKIVIQDDGIGFDYSPESQTMTPEGGFGLFSIQERMADLDGEFDIQSEPGKGCRVVLTIPMGEGKD